MKGLMVLYVICFLTNNSTLAQQYDILTGGAETNKSLPFEPYYELLAFVSNIEYSEKCMERDYQVDSCTSSKKGYDRLAAL